MTRQAQRRLLGAALWGAAAGALGTTAMDLVEFRRYRQAGGTERLLTWETSVGVKKWKEASAPGQFGKWVAEGLTGRELPDQWARSTTNLVHWATGLGWGAQFGLVAALSRRHRLALSVLLGPTAWLTGYVILPVAKVYKPIWDYDATTLAKDFTAHMAYGSVTAASFAVLARRLRRS
jgi:hypothetical protein